MVGLKALLSVQSLLLLSRGAFGQDQHSLPQPNATMYIPAINLVTLASDEFLLVSSVTTQKGSSTVFKIFDAKPTTTNTLTLILSPTGAAFSGTDHSLGDDNLDLKLNVTCTIVNDNSTCTVIAAQSDSQTLSTVINESTSDAIPVVALNFQPPATSSSSPSASPTSAGSGNSPASSPTPTNPPVSPTGTSPAPTNTSGNTTTTPPSSSALKSQLSIGSIAAVAFSLLFKLM